MSAPAADAVEKLRTVLDYLPCEACLASPVAHQEVLCSICRRIDRVVGVRVAVKTTFLVERPSDAEAPVIIPPAVPTEAPAPTPPAVEVVWADAERPARPEAPTIEVVVEPLVEDAPVVAAPAAAVAPAPNEAEPEWDDVASFEPRFDDMFETVPGGSPPSRPVAEPEREIAREPLPEMPQDDFVFRPPPASETAPAQAEEELVEDWMPSDEVSVEPERDERSRWAPPAEFEPVAEPAPPEEAPAQAEVVEDELVEDDAIESTVVEEEPILAAEVVEEEVLESTLVEDAPVEAEVLDAEVVDADVVDAEVVDAEPVEEELPSSGLWRLRGFDQDAESKLAAANIREVSHLSGHDPNELALRVGVPAARLTPWIHVADLVQEVGVPMAPAIALVAAGVAGPKGLRETDPETIIERAAAFGGAEVKLSDVKRWKRRA